MMLKTSKGFCTPEGRILKPGTIIEVTEIDMDGIYWLKCAKKNTRFCIAPIDVQNDFVTEITEPTEKEQEQWLGLLM